MTDNQELFYGKLLKRLENNEGFEKLLKRIENNEGYQNKEIEIIEKECVEGIREWLRQRNITIIKQEEHFIKRLNDPFNNKEITELDGAIIIKNNHTDQRSLIIVETKHFANELEIKDKLSQMPLIQRWIDEEKKYYQCSQQLNLINININKIKNEIKILRRKKRRGNSNSNTDFLINEKEETLCKFQLEETLLDDKLDEIIEENKWHKNFIKTLKTQDLRFDKFILFFGAPLWEKENYKNDLLKKNIGVVELSGNRYKVRPDFTPTN